MVALLLLMACADATGGWDTEAGQRVVRPHYYVTPWSCGSDGAGVLDLPDGAPLMMQIWGENTEDEGYVEWWVYDEVPHFTPGASITIPCSDPQDGGRIVYVHE
ncbi:MAG: hypothetical protein Q8P41_25075 [Pseudomonadota bacterium]|nr:hypothetical protein [Pseudomonadota bacterium]